MGQLEHGSGFWPLAVAQAVGVVCVALTAAAMRSPWVPAHRSDAWGLVAGVLATAAVVAFMFASREGSLSIAAVITSLYPAVTIVLAATVLRERIHGLQACGLALCALAVAFVASG